MSKTIVVRYRARTAEAAAQNQSLVENVFAQLAADQPEGLRYATFRLGDGLTFVHVAVHEGGGNALEDVEAFEAFQRGIQSRIDGPPEVSEATLVGSYRLMDAVIS